MKLVNKYSWIEKFRQGMGRMVLGVSLLLGASVLEAGPSPSVVHLGCSKKSKDFSSSTYTSVPMTVGTESYNLYTCDDEAYGTGNLGTWAELDLVPHRMHINNATGSVQDINYSVGGTYILNGNMGWDYITPLTLDTDLSNQECKDWAAIPGNAVNQTLTITGDVNDSIIFRNLEVRNLPDGANCYANYNMRLAIGASKYPGSKLHDYLLYGGLKTLPLPSITPTTLSKGMTAALAGSRAWIVTKSANDTSMTFNDTCDDSLPLYQDVNITVTWTRGEITTEGVNIVTIISASNNAERDMDINVTDTIYSGTVPLDTFNCVVPLPAKSGLQEVCRHSFTADANNSDLLNDIAVARYIETDIPGHPILLVQTATANAIAQSGEGSDDNATIRDHEWIVGADFNYSVTSVTSTTGVTGTFDNGYTVGTETHGDVNWTSDLQDADGNVIFHKRIYTKYATASTGNTLTDKATLNGSDGFYAENTLSININSYATVSLTIEKIMDPADIPAGETLDFNFTILSGLTIPPFNETHTLSVNATNTSDSITIDGLTPSTYTVTEIAKSGYEPEEIDGPVREVDLNLPVCAATETFTNVPADRPLVRVKKLTVPAGNEAGWTMTLLEQNASAPTGWTPITTGITDTDWVTLVDTDTLNEGTYKIVEEMQDDWYEINSTGCTFTFELPRDANRSDFSCLFGNAKYANITITKEVDGISDGPFGFTQDINASDPLLLQDGETKEYLKLRLPYTNPYTVTETNPAFDDISPDYDLIGLECVETGGEENTITDIRTHKALINLEAGETVDCTFTNQERGTINVIKKEDGNTTTTETWTFTLSAPEEGSVTRETNATGGLDFGDINLKPGRTYTLCEVGIHVAWDANWTLNGTPVSPVTKLHEDHVDRCYDFNVSVGQEAEFVIDNISPNPGINIEKWTNGHDADTFTGPFITTGSLVTWTYYVSNFGDTNLTDVNVSDSDLNVMVNCPQDTLEVDETIICTASGEAISGQYTNIGTVTAKSVANPIEAVNDSDPSHYYGVNASIDIEKYTNDEDADEITGPHILVGDDVNWTYDVTNTGDVRLININVTDDQGVEVDCRGITELAPDQSMTCTAYGIATEGQYVNRGTVVGTPEVGERVAGDDVTDTDLSHYLGEIDCICDDIPSGGGGCTYNPNSKSFDMMYILMLLSVLFFGRRELKRNER